MLGAILKAYREFESRVEYLGAKKLSKTERIKALLDQTVGIITKKEIMTRCPDISKITVERTLSQLLQSGLLIKVGQGRNTGYVHKG